MERVLGIGGFFFRSKNPKALAAWYGEHLGLEIKYGMAKFHHKADPHPDPVAAWTPFEESSTYFPATQSWMMNFRVADLDAMLAQLRNAGVQVEAETQDSEYGKFGWCFDPEGNKIELWQPPAT